MLTQYFNPMPEDANQSVRRIVTDVELGSFVRGVHFWAAQAMYVLAGLHLLRVFLTASYKRPREANWLIGVAMFGLVTGAIFTGTVIKWDQEGFEALAHNLEIGRLLGGAGFWFTAEFSGQLPLIVRLYVAHVAIIPGLILGLLPRRQRGHHGHASTESPATGEVVGVTPPQRGRAPRSAPTASVAGVIESLLGGDLPVALECYDGSRAGPKDAPATIIVRSPDALRRALLAPGELGFGRAYVAGDLDVEGDVYAVLSLGHQLQAPRLSPRHWLSVARLAGAAGLRPLPVPPEEARLRGRRHSQARDAAAIAHHYDVSNAFYRLVLGPSMTYSCAVWPNADATLEEAQAAKYELVCRKLGLAPGMRLLDVGCGWGGMVIHAARHHGVRAVGVTLSAPQADWARDAVATAGVGDRVEIRV